MAAEPSLSGAAAAPRSRLSDSTEDEKSFKDQRTHKKALTNFIAGAVGGAGSTSLSHPLDTVKVKLQTFPHLYRGGLHCIREVIRLDGISGFYRGLTPGVTLSMTEASIRYMTYGICQDTVRKLTSIVAGEVEARSSERMTLVDNALAGGLTGFLSTFASCPIELIKCRMQGMLEIHTSRTVEPAVSSNKTVRGPGAVIGQVLRTEGVRGFYHGFSSNVARNTPGEMVFFATYEQCRHFAKTPGRVKDDIGPLGSFLCGSCAGIAYWTSIYPLDCVKSRVQIMSSQGKVQGLWTMFFTILRTEGILRLYHGVGYSIPRAIIGSGSHFVFYETTRKFILKRTASDEVQ